LATIARRTHNPTAPGQSFAAFATPLTHPPAGDPRACPSRLGAEFVDDLYHPTMCRLNSANSSAGTHSSRIVRPGLPNRVPRQKPGVDVEARHVTDAGGGTFQSRAIRIA